MLYFTLSFLGGIYGLKVISDHMHSAIYRSHEKFACHLKVGDHLLWNQTVQLINPYFYTLNSYYFIHLGPFLFSKEIEIGKVSHDRAVRIDTADGDQILCER